MRLSGMSYNFKIAICDDSKADRMILKIKLQQYLNMYDYPIEIDEFSSGDELLASDCNVYGLVIMDIFMQGMNGIETAQQLIERNGKTSIILCSSSNEYASESYDIGAIRYLLKPISQEKFYRSLDVFFEKYADKDPILYRSMRLEHSISKRNVLWIEAQGKKSIIHTINEAIETTNAFSEYIKLTDSGEFIRPIRYAIVRKSVVSKWQGKELILTDGTQIPVSRTYRKEMEKVFPKE